MDELLSEENRQAARSVMKHLEDVLGEMRASKPDQRSELARRYAVTITELEKTVAYFQVFVLGYLERGY